MKTIQILIVGIGLTAVGCNSRLLNKEKPAESNPQTVIVGNGYESAGACPELSTEVPAGFTLTAHYGTLQSKPVTLKSDISTTWVLIRDVGTWFRIGTRYSGAYYYERSGTEIKYQGQWLSGKEYCVYEFIPNP